jgi:hypothetical protein
MKIKHVRLKNYKGFRDSGEIAFGDKFTVLVGQNNAGKTALLEALSTRAFKHNPFREPRKRGGFPPVHNPESAIVFAAAFSGAELKWRVLDSGLGFQLAVSSREGNARDKVEHFFSSAEIKVTTRFVPGAAWQAVGESLLSAHPAGSAKTSWT